MYGVLLANFLPDLRWYTRNCCIKKQLEAGRMFTVYLYVFPIMGVAKTQSTSPPTSSVLPCFSVSLYLCYIPVSHPFQGFLCPAPRSGHEATLWVLFPRSWKAHNTHWVVHLLVDSRLVFSRMTWRQGEDVPEPQSWKCSIDRAVIEIWNPKSYVGQLIKSKDVI